MRKWIDRIAAVVDPDQVCRLALDLCDIASPTGEEDVLSAFIVEWFNRNGFIVSARRRKPIDLTRSGFWVVGALGQA
jgi:hypothetical protein